MADMEVYASIGQKGLCLLHRGNRENPWELGDSCPAMFGASNCSRHCCLLHPSGAGQLVFYLELGGAARDWVWGAGISPAGPVCSMEMWGCTGHLMVSALPGPATPPGPCPLAPRAPQNQPAFSSPKPTCPQLPKTNLLSAPQI